MPSACLKSLHLHGHTFWDHGECLMRSAHWQQALLGGPEIPATPRYPRTPYPDPWPQGLEYTPEGTDEGMGHPQVPLTAWRMAERVILKLFEDAGGWEEES